MRITDILSTSDTLSKAQYERIRPKCVKVIMCDPDGWDFSKEEDTEEAEARRWVQQLRQRAAYETRHGITGTAPVLIVRFIVESKDEQEPGWPEELKPYQDKTNNILEAYFCNKYNIPCG